MAIRYYKLFDFLHRHNMKISDLRSIISSATIAKINKHQYVSGETIDKICKFLKCQPYEIMEYVELGSEKESTETEYKPKELAIYREGTEERKIIRINSYDPLNNNE